MPMLTCRQCKIEFKSRSKGKIYCSRTCYNNHHKVSKTCPMCSKSFIALASSSKIYCGQSCASKDSIDARRNGLLQRYGVTSPGLLPDHIEKMKKTNMKNFGVEFPAQSEEVRQQMKQTNLLTHGDENYNNIEQVRQTKKERYGDENYNNTPQILKTTAQKHPTLYEDNRERMISLHEDRDIGVNSPKFKQFLRDNNVTNASQLSSVAEKKRKIQLSKKYNSFFEEPFVSLFEPLFALDDYTGSINYEIYKFLCKTCMSEFEGNCRNGMLPRCTICYPLHPKVSKFEKEVLAYIVEHLDGTHDVIENDRVVLDGKELDIYIPSLKLAFECDGIYWHGESQGKDKTYHLDKTLQCQAKDITLIHIFENEWIGCPVVIKSIILQKLNSPRISSIMARKCAIREIDAETANSFLIKNHIQGRDRSSIRYGLFYDTDLVMVMTFVKSRFAKNYEWEISRLATQCDVRVTGGAQKLWAHFVKINNPSSCITYSDRRYFTGNVYKTLGFEFLRFSPPSYHYFHEDLELLNRLQFQKHKLKESLPHYNDQLTEWENMKLHGFDRIWDCGHSAWHWKR